MPDAKIYEIISMFPNFNYISEEEEGLFYDCDAKNNKKAFQQMII